MKKNVLLIFCGIMVITLPVHASGNLPNQPDSVLIHKTIILENFEWLPFSGTWQSSVTYESSSNGIIDQRTYDVPDESDKSRIDQVLEVVAMILLLRLVLIFLFDWYLINSFLERKKTEKAKKMWKIIRTSLRGRKILYPEIFVPAILMTGFFCTLSGNDWFWISLFFWVFMLSITLVVARKMVFRKINRNLFYVIKKIAAHDRTVSN